MGWRDRQGGDEPCTLGEEYEDSITGFKGIATSRTTFLYGCVRIGLEGKGTDGKPDEMVFDEQRLTSKPAATSGGDQPPVPRTGQRR